MVPVLLDDTMDLLSNRSRRHILYALSDMRETLTYDQLTERMVAEEYLRGEEKEMFEAQLKHNHLPRLAESGVVEYDERSRTIRRIPASDLQEILDFIEKFED